MTQPAGPSQSNFGFLLPRWRRVVDETRQAERYTLNDPRTGLVYTRRALEAVVDWMYRADRTLRKPLQDSLHNRMTAPEFTRAVPPAVLDLMHAVRKTGNNAAHGTGDVPGPLAARSLIDLWQVCLWLARTYAADATARPGPGLRFRPDLLPRESTEPRLTAPARAQLQEELEAKDAELAAAAARDEHARAEIAKLQAQIAEQKAANQAIPDDVDYSEAATREFIDLYLREAGWDPQAPQVSEFPVSWPDPATGSPRQGRADYVLWGRDGLPLAVIEAKRASKDPSAGRDQARFYADGLEQRYGRRPVIYFTNGYRHWLWDDQVSPEREVLGFHTRDELQLMVARRQDRQRLATRPLPEGIADRPYQQRALRAVAEAFDGEQPRRRALLVMATGTGKTRTVIALAKFLQDARWVKRVLFLADRTALVTQAQRAFAAQLENSSPAVVGQSTAEDLAASRIHLATYPAIMNVIDASTEGRLTGPQWRGVGYYDLIVVDEAHRSIYLKYRQIFSYFDALVVGLTATPHDEVDRNTYELFGIQDNNPTSGYELNEAVADGYLVPPRVLEIGTSFTRDGARYAELSETEKAEWDEKEWDDDGAIPDEVGAADMNRWLFNQQTVDHVITSLMTHGRHIQGGNLIGKTIIFARNNDHAEFIKARFDALHPQYKGALATVITYRSPRAHDLIDEFSLPYAPDQAKLGPQIAISVDMLDTGIDVPDVVNLVFFKPVYSKAKFWQMVGRGTRLRPGLFGDGSGASVGDDAPAPASDNSSASDTDADADDRRDKGGPNGEKDYFFILDAMGNVEFFNAGLEARAAALPRTLSHRTFATRLGLLEEATRQMPQDPYTSDLINHLARQVGQWPEANHAVRPHVEAVRRWSRPEAWTHLGLEDAALVSGSLAPLASLTVEQGSEEAQRFDLLVLKAQLASLQGDTAQAEALGRRLFTVANALHDLGNIPAVQDKMPLIESILDTADQAQAWDQADPRWLEGIRRGLRDLVALIESKQRKLVYANFTDTPDEVRQAELRGATEYTFNLSFYRERMQAYLNTHLENFALRRLRSGKALTTADLDALEHLLLESGLGSPEDLERAAQGQLVAFIRSLVGLDREAVLEALSGFMSGSTLTTAQQLYLDQVVRMLVKGGKVNAGALFEAPFSDVHPNGPAELFPADQVTVLFEIVNRLGGQEDVA